MSESTSKPKSNRKTVWSETQGSRYQIVPRLGMLKEKDYIITRNVSLIGEPKSKFFRSEITDVHYNEDYVIHWIASKLGEIILGIDRSELLKIITKAKEIARSENKQ